MNGVTWLVATGIAIGAVLLGVAVWLWYVVKDLPDALTPGAFEPTGVLFDNVRLVSMVPGVSMDTVFYDLSGRVVLRPLSCR
jgi:hypothetical protein